MAPLPEGIWLSGTEAQELAHRAFFEYISELVASRELPPVEVAVSIGMADALLREILRCAGEGTVGPVGLRTYVTTGGDYKRTAPERMGESRALLTERLSYVNLPRFVWVVELVARTIRNENVSTGGDRPSTLGEMVIDATAPEARAATTFLMALPGLANVYGHPEWFPIGAEPYGTGRNQHQREDLNEAVRAAWTRMKSSVPPVQHGL
jgi:hypothetical protein